MDIRTRVLLAFIVIFGSVLHAADTNNGKGVTNLQGKLYAGTKMVGSSEIAFIDATKVPDGLTENQRREMIFNGGPKTSAKAGCSAKQRQIELNEVYEEYKKWCARLDERYRYMFDRKKEIRANRNNSGANVQEQIRQVERDYASEIAPLIKSMKDVQKKFDDLFQGLAQDIKAQQGGILTNQGWLLVPVENNGKFQVPLAVPGRYIVVVLEPLNTPEATQYVLYTLDIMKGTTALKISSDQYSFRKQKER